ncbi:MAG: hypothetical protein A2Y34_12415 [Spirochaetes bacterium GWC1_27_15]|nr:MAG: hypothetical protein A2Y34_12415 [Spirochaetes bacterium GWC1_27_15]
MYNKPSDKFYPSNYLMLQAFYIFPVKKYFGIGPSFFSENVFKIFHYEDSIDTKSININFNTIILGGLSFSFMPHHPKLDIPLLIFFVDFGPSVELNNITDDGDNLAAKFGGYTSQFLTIPLMPWHLIIIDINIFSVMATQTSLGWFPGILNKNFFSLKFSFFNFIKKNVNSGIRLKNTFSFILTGKPSINDLTSQYTYDRLEFSLFYGGVKGLELHLGYGFEYITFARDPEYHIANKIIGEISYEKNGFKISLKHFLIFWDANIQNGLPVNEFEILFSYKLNIF